MQTALDSTRETIRATCKKPLKISKSIWDADDDEFPDWPQTFKTAFDTFKCRATTSTTNHSTHGQNGFVTASSAETDGTLDDSASNSCDGRSTWESPHLRSEEHFRDIIEELCDPAWSNPLEPDAHDRLMQQFFTFKYSDLPGDSPARHMHVIDWRAYLGYRSPPDDRIIEYVRPRLCDAVATVLRETGLKCLDDFLDSKSECFEWRRIVTQAERKSCVVIRRVGNEVVAGTYRNLGFKYLWQFYVRSQISLTGKWTDTFAGGRGTTAVSSAGPQWCDYEAPDSAEKQDGSDAKHAFFIGRHLAHHLLEGKYWDYVEERGVTVEWEVDGKVTKGKMQARSNRYDEEDD